MRTFDRFAMELADAEVGAVMEMADDLFEEEVFTPRYNWCPDHVLRERFAALADR